MKLKNGVRWRFRKTVHGQMLSSRFIFTSKKKALEAEEAAAAQFQATGEVLPPSETSSPSETVAQLYRRWIRWLRLHRSERHSQDMTSLMARALEQWPEMAGLPAEDLTIDQVEAWAERWALDLLDRGKGRGEVNKWLRYSQTAFNAPWGKRRALREISFNPFKHIDRFAVDRQAKYVPTPAEVAALLMAAEEEFRLYLEILVATAARVSEGRQLAWQDVQYQVPPYGIVLYTQKTAAGDRTPRRLEIPKKLAAGFRTWRRQQGQGKLYVFQQTNNPAPRVVTWEAKQMRKTCQKAGVDYFPPSCFRHFAASKWAADGDSLTTIQNRLGHTQATTTNNYLKELQLL